MNDLLIICSAPPALLIMIYVAMKTNATLANAAFWWGLAGGVAAGFLVALSKGLICLAAGPGMVLTFGTATRDAFLIAAVPEEAAKGLVLLGFLALIGRRRRRGDTLILATGIGLGFALLENLLSLRGEGVAVLAVALGRGVSALPAHGVFGLTMGALAMAARLGGENRLALSLLAFLVPMTMHGAYDTIAFVSGPAAPWAVPAELLWVTGISLLAVTLCNTILPVVAAREPAPDRERRAPGMSRMAMARASLCLLVAPLAQLVAGGFEAAQCWTLALYCTLPLTLSFDLMRDLALLPRGFTFMRRLILGDLMAAPAGRFAPSPGSAAG